MTNNSGNKQGYGKYPGNPSQKKPAKKKDNRIRRDATEKNTPIEVSEVEFDILVAYLNSISDNLKQHLIADGSWKVNSIVCPFLKTIKIPQSIKDGKEKLINTITLVPLALQDSDKKEYTTKLLSFAKNNRYLNITKTDKSIRLENSDKYPHFNIFMEFEKDSISFMIYSRRLFKMDTTTIKPKFFKVLFGK